MRRRTTLASGFDPRRNALNALRLILACVVIVSHSWIIGGYGTEPGIAGRSIGNIAVVGFFGISGYLITMSRSRSRSLGDFVRRRVLRIYPGYLVVLVVTAFGFAPLSVVAFGNGTWEPGAAVGYVLKNLGLFAVQYPIPGTLQGVPYPGAWNGSTWTLFYEFVCYLAIGLLMTVLPGRAIRPAVLGALVLLSALELGVVLGVPLPHVVELLVRLGAVFAAGSVLRLLQERIPLSGWLALAALGLLVVSLPLRLFDVVAPLPMSYLMLWLGARLPLRSVGATHDVSYGMYVYGFPVTQLLQLALPGRLVPVAVFAALAVLATAPFAVASWFAIERPAMRLKRPGVRQRAERVVGLPEA